MNYYSATPATTANGTPIPDGVFFVQTNPAGETIRAWRIPFNYNYASGPSGLNALPQFEINVAQLPPVLKRPVVTSASGGAVGAKKDDR